MTPIKMPITRPVAIHPTKPIKYAFIILHKSADKLTKITLYRQSHKG
ncbi:hypothetical protein PROVALCAL_01475 [Providencia alcalifaciens DSM 30120]|uniref:Uncharacterized protein n=1 Tax=Providencia alcalifaciens DSM 30120 TaxID=520999 RepID=B6XDQ1_9GAMM|nr:hypothetical protein PROVALCAL_01475 [Providencia alcalifaciens DSM 30120]